MDNINLKGKYMPHTITLQSQEEKTRASNLILSLPDTPVYEVVIRKHKKDRSLAQNAVLWLWYTVIAGELGYTKDDMHLIYKKKYLVPIFERDDPEYAKMIESVRTVWKAGLKKDAHSLKDQIVKLTSTTDANTKQFTEYLDDIEKDAIGQGIILPQPENQYKQAMGG